MRRADAHAVEALVAVALSAGACVEIALGARHPPALFVSGLVVTASVAWRHRAPIAAAVAALGGLAAFGSLATGPNAVVLAALALVFFGLGPAGGDQPARPLGGGGPVGGIGGGGGVHQRGTVGA